ncbi:hypothetical protein H2248_004271 [Termitomyces sp. 'cryptogamus']|nr:hypothetical protein H2248_004271 [Termitomyces sp. 'cryptogamus']
MLRQISNWLYPSSAPSTNMPEISSNEALNQARFEAKKEKKEMSCDDTSGGKDMALDGQGSLQSGSHREESKLRRTAPPMAVPKPESSHPRGRPASGPFNAKDPEIAVASTQRTEVVMARGKKEAGHGRTGREEAQSIRDSELLTIQAEVDNMRKKLEESERERAWLSKILDDEKREKRDLKNTQATDFGLVQKEAHALRHRINQMEKENSQKSKALDITTKELDRAARENESLRNDMGIAQQQIEDLRAQVEATHRQIDNNTIHYNRQKQELQAIKEQFQRAEIVHQRTREQLTERTAELQNTQRFIDVADSLSGADIINMTTALNAEILQSAALMADSLNYTKRHGEAPKEVLLRLQENIGKNLTQALIDQKFVDGKDVDPTPVQLALQVCLVACSATIVTSWTLEGNDSRLSQIYSRIWDKEKQSVAGRWRSMTQMHAAAEDGPDLTLHMILRAVESILIVTRVEYRPSINQFQERLSTINTLSLHLRSSIAQRITSMDIYPFTFRPGIAFDPSRMDDTYAEERKSNLRAVEVGEPIAGSTELGLFSRVRAINGKVETKVMLKPKVVLCSALTEDG